ncbi:MAG: hypothetical protein RSA55_02725, partial [Clostridia bacterium]
MIQMASMRGKKSAEIYANLVHRQTILSKPLVWFQKHPSCPTLAAQVFTHVIRFAMRASLLFYISALVSCPFSNRIKCGMIMKRSVKATKVTERGFLMKRHWLKWICMGLGLLTFLLIALNLNNASAV